jgi:hypothetical protein
MTQVAFGNGRVLELSVNVSAEAMEAFACAMPALPRNARVVVSVNRGAHAVQPAHRLEELLDWVAGEMGVAGPAIVGPSRVPRDVRARDAFCWGASKLLGRSNADLGRRLGRDHSSIRAAIERAEALCETDETVRGFFLRMAALFTGAVS